MTARACASTTHAHSPRRSGLDLGVLDALSIRVVMTEFAANLVFWIGWPACGWLLAHHAGWSWLASAGGGLVAAVALALVTSAVGGALKDPDR